MATHNHIAKTAAGKLICPDCLHEMNEEVYVDGYSTWTCKTSGCSLTGTTLGANEWAKANLNDYREINRRDIVYATHDNLRYAVLELERNGVISRQVLEFAVVPEIAIEIKMLAKEGYSAREIATYFTESAAQAAANQ